MQLSTSRSQSNGSSVCFNTVTSQPGAVLASLRRNKKNKKNGGSGQRGEPTQDGRITGRSVQRGCGEGSSLARPRPAQLRRAQPSPVQRSAAQRKPSQRSATSLPHQPRPCIRRLLTTGAPAGRGSEQSAPRWQPSPCVRGESKRGTALGLAWRASGGRGRRPVRCAPRSAPPLEVGHGCTACCCKTVAASRAVQPRQVTTPLHPNPPIQLHSAAFTPPTPPTSTPGSRSLC